MRLLIVTQVVDRNDSVLGFFVRWIEEFAKHVERLEVICLREGSHAFPANVRVYSLGKIEGIERKAVGSSILNRMQYSSRFLSLIWKLRRDYDAVFVHMNPEYVVLGGLFWRLWKKRVALWYTHKSVDTKLRFATFFANSIFTASEESFRLATKKVRVVGHGIDTDFFSPDPTIPRGMALLSVGRLMPSKRHDLAIRAAALAGRELRIAGEGSERKNLEMLAHSLGARVHFLGGLTQEQLRDEYRKAAFFVHASETGSLDKVVLEALATDVSVVTTADVFKKFPVHTVSATPEAITEALTHTRESHDRVEIIRRDHSLAHLIPFIVKTI